MIHRRTFLVTAAGVLLAEPVGASAQQQGKVVRIGLLDYAAPDPGRVGWWKAFHERLRELGYLEGQNIVFEPRWGNGEVGRLPSLAADLVRTRVDVIVTAGS